MRAAVAPPAMVGVHTHGRSTREVRQNLVDVLVHLQEQQLLHPDSKFVATIPIAVDLLLLLSRSALLLSKERCQGAHASRTARRRQRQASTPNGRSARRPTGCMWLQGGYTTPTEKGLLQF